ncbi:MAG: hypothetical protein HY684_01210 [Chloroflexi bacterium]|nr:hypothetical protein [Chloroflexota bacterium]
MLIAVRTYPTPAWKGVEVSCTAGITDESQWIRLFPVPYRFLSPDKRFRKYQWIEVNAKKASDPRPESYELDIDSIQIRSEPIPTTSNWQARKDIVFPLKAHCLCCLKAQRDEKDAPTLGIFKPKTINSFHIEKAEPEWSPEQAARLRQSSFFDTQPVRELEKIPYTFKYKFACDEPSCHSHELMCTDWEVGQSYHNWVRRYGSDWERYFKQRYETEMILINDTHFYVGTMHEHPDSWIIVGLFYPKPL